MISKLRALVRLSRPYYAIQAIAPPVAGYVAGARNFSFLTAAALGTVFGLLAMAAWATNDVVDRDLDSRGKQKRLGRFYVAGGTGVLHERKVRQRVAIVYISALVVTALCVASMFGNWFLMSATSCGLVGVFYSVAPIRLKSKGLFGAGLTSLSYGLVALGAGYVVGGGRIGVSTLVFGMAMSILVLGYDGLGHIIDYDDDKRSGENTFAVQLGVANAIKLLAACQVLPIVAIYGLGITGLLTIHLTGATLLLGAAAFSSFLLLFTRNRGHLSVLRLAAVPFLSLCFFMLR